MCQSCSKHGLALKKAHANNEVQSPVVVNSRGFVLLHDEAKMSPGRKSGSSNGTFHWILECNFQSQPNDIMLRVKMNDI